jgi:prepilin-type N-terminal cleavage/methylation domain-containing protein
MTKRRGFTLIEVMVAVMIIAVAIGAILQIESNNTHLVMKIKQDQVAQEYLSLVIGNKQYGFENEDVTLDRFIDRFDVDGNLRRELKSKKITLIYQKIEDLDLTQSDDENLSSSAITSVEIGRTIIKLPNSSASIVRIRLP